MKVINKKMPGIFRPSMRLYFMCLILFAIFTFFFGAYGNILAAAEAVVVIFLWVYTRLSNKRYEKNLLEYIETVTDSMSSSTKDTPLPVVIFNSKSNNVLWSNEKFLSITGERQRFFEIRINDIVPEFPTTWLLDGKNECPQLVTVGGRKFKIYGNLVRLVRDLGLHEYAATTYWVDVTEYSQVYEEYVNSKPVLAIILLDSYEELIKGMTEKEKSTLLSDIDEMIHEWAKTNGGLICRYGRDRYLFMFEHRELEEFVADKFSILEKVQSFASASGVHATMCIGIGKDGKNPAENFHYANLATDMALSRGGDQVVVKDRFNFEFYGGHSGEVEKRTKVKSRVMANAFGELISDASTVYIMGHKNADLDAVGAAVGICCVCRSRGKKAHIVIDMAENLSQSLIERVTQAEEYAGVFISPQDAIVEADSKSLLIVVDTSRPEQVESETLLLSCNRVAVIDKTRIK